MSRTCQAIAAIVVCLVAVETAQAAKKKSRRSQEDQLVRQIGRVTAEVDGLKLEVEKREEALRLGRAGEGQMAALSPKDKRAVVLELERDLQGARRRLAQQESILLRKEQALAATLEAPVGYEHPSKWMQAAHPNDLKVALRAARETLDGLGWLAEDPRRVATTADIGERMAGALGAGAPEALREKADQMLAPENLPKYAGDVAEQVAELERRLVRAEEEAAQRKAAQKRQRQQRNGRKSRHQPEQDPKGARAGASGGGSPSRRGKPSRSVAQVERDFGLDGSLRGSFSQPLSDHYRLAAANQRFKPSGGERNVLDKLASDNPQLEGVPHCEVLCRLFRDLELLAAGHDTQLLKLVPVAATEAGRKKRKKKRSGTGDSATALVGKEAVFSLLHKAAAQRPAQRLGNIRWAAPSRQASRPAVKAATRQ